jgi:cytochrome c peroxidase
VLLRDLDGVSGVAVGPDHRIYALAAFERALVVRDGRAVRRIALGAGRLDAVSALGRRLFHKRSPSISNSLLTCVTCHPDGREDGLVWSNRGEVLQTPMLVERLAGTEPYNWHGTSATLEASIVNTLGRLGGRGLTHDELSALVHYVKNDLPKPTRLPATEPKLLAEGAALFNSDEVGCASCHPGELEFTDGATHSGIAPAARGASFATPSLRFVGLTPPYLHDGSAPSLTAWLDQNHDRMGKTDQLNPSQRRALVAYLESL